MVRRPSIKGPDFDRQLLMRKGADKYRDDKIKAGTVGGATHKGSIRPWSKKNMVIARLYRKSSAGEKFSATALESFSKFEAGKMYTLLVPEMGTTGTVIVGGLPMPIKEAVDKFKIHKNA